MYGYIYKTTNLITKKIYVGQHKKSVFDAEYYGSGKHLLRSMKKYGKENFICEVLEWCETKSSLDQREIYWIDNLHARDHKIGYNIAFGGDGGDLVTCLSDEDYRRFSNLVSELNRKGVIGNKGKHLSDEHRKKISESNKGKKRSPEAIEKHRQAILGKAPWNKGLKAKDDERVRKHIHKKGEYHHTEATRKKISQNIKHRENMGKYPKSEEHRKKLSEAHKGRMWVTNGEVSKIVRPEELEDYLSMGYRLGLVRRNSK